MEICTWKWARNGAIAFAAMGVLLLPPQFLLPYDQAFHKTVNHLWFAVASPVLSIWNKLGFQGTENLAVVSFMVASVLLTLAAAGFVLGFLAAKLAAAMPTARRP